MVNVNDIRICAYFHFANRTGTNWQDSTLNWIQVEAEEEALAAAIGPGHYRRTLYVSCLVVTHSESGFAGDRCKGRKWSDSPDRSSRRTQTAANSLAFIRETL